MSSQEEYKPTPEEQRQIAIFRNELTFNEKRKNIMPIFVDKLHDYLYSLSRDSYCRFIRSSYYNQGLDIYSMDISNLSENHMILYLTFIHGKYLDDFEYSPDIAENLKEITEEDLIILEAKCRFFLEHHLDACCHKVLKKFTTTHKLFK